MSADLSRPPERILLIRLKGIGDVILSTPLLRALRKKFPQAQLHFLTRSFCAPILKGNPYLDQLIVHPEKTASFGEKLAIFGQLRAANYDWVLDLAAEPRSAWLTLATGAPLRAGYAFRIRKWAFNYRIPKNTVRKYQAEVNLDILRAVGVADDGNRTEIYLTQEEKDWAEKTIAGPDFADLKWKIGLNPTGTWSSKRWPAVYWRELAEKIHSNLGVKPILLGGPGDQALLEEVRSGMEGKILVKPETTLRQAAAFISKLDILIGNDGTPQHLAQVFGTKSLTLCGPHWGMGWVKPGDVRHRYLQYFLDCGPCDFNVCPFPKEYWKEKHFHQECLVKITPSEVFSVSREMLAL